MVTITLRCYKILSIICNKQAPVTALAISHELGISERSVRYDISLLSDWLKEKEITLVHAPRKGFYIEKKDLKKASTLLEYANPDTLQTELFMNSQDRVNFILGHILECDKSKSIENISDWLNVSKTTVLRDMDKAGKWFSDHGYKLDRHCRKGVKLEVDEIQKRRLLVELMIEQNGEVSRYPFGLINTMNLDSDNYIVRIIYNTDFDGMIDNCKKLFKNIDIIVSDKSFFWIMCYIAVAMYRFNNGQVIKELPQRFVQLTGSIVYERLLEEILRQLKFNGKDDHVSNEAAYLTALILSSKVKEADVKSKDEDIADMISHLIISKYYQDTGCDLRSDWELHNSLKKHLEMTMSRVKYDFLNQNEMLPDIRNKFYTVYSACEKIVSQTNEAFGMEIDKNEIGYITLHIAAAQRRISNQELSYNVRVVLLCEYGNSTEEYLIKSIKAEFPNIYIVTKISLFEVEKYDFSNVDIVISTININFPLPKPLIIITPLLTKYDIRKINAFFYKDTTQNFLLVKEFRLRELLSIINDNCDINNADRLKNELEKAMDSYMNNTLGIVSLPSLMDVISPKFSIASIEAENWEMAVRKSAQPLLDNNCITSEYIEGIIEMKEKYNQYSIITNNVCMPHAFPRAMTKLAVSLATLKTPVYIELEEQVIEIKVIMVLATIDSTTHAKVIDEVFSLFDEYPSLPDNLMNQKTNRDLFKMFKEFYYKIFR